MVEMTRPSWLRNLTLLTILVKDSRPFYVRNLRASDSFGRVNPTLEVVEHLTPDHFDEGDSDFLV